MNPLNNVQKLDIVPLREAFPHEAHNFTKWLEDNIDALSSRIGIQLSVLEREKAVGSFSVDLFCETVNGRYAIVENQLERSNHDHLGKLLTYLVNLEATTAIWVVAEVRPEHQRVIDWLNESISSDYAFYLVRVEAIRIGNSPYAPLFTVLIKPDEQTREIGETKKEFADRHYARKEFWTQLLEKSKNRTKLYSAVAPGTSYWLNTGAGKTGLLFSYNIFQYWAWIELYINTGNTDKNKAVFDSLFLQKDEIESEIGEPLQWDRRDEKPISRIHKDIRSFGGLTTPQNWADLQNEMITTMIIFDAVFRPRILALT